MVQNVYCVGRNYKLHAEELGNEVPTEPMIFLKPSHAVVKADGRELPFPADQGEIHYETELVIRIGRPYEKGMAVQDLVDVAALGIDFTLRDVQSILKKKGQPWTAAKGFLHSAPITSYFAFPDKEELESKDFTLLLNGKEAQRGNVKNMIFSLQVIVDYIAEHYGLGEGDLIFTGTPEGVGPVAKGDKLELAWDGQVLGSCIIGSKES
ncbi:fumarylacetoacetate hydrolase family protein [Paenibacillus physcomitrellae]|uniref:Fumarylacetoacetate hydrolase n=1 Tax=Paenibacillus physcomitrellae TaxID=1619311 RepID=A0ABQ1GJ82_9BACL|nr:fumarylacetoacetate hydrolase family protein [Paenibacillus physcomitrellae]GGA44739.1 fumarylacetoacetate hydrolase [Paenibacillus physcomitrellae]